MIAAASLLVLVGFLLISRRSSREDEAEVLLQAQANLAEARACMERAKHYNELPGQKFLAAMMAARAIGYEGFGRKTQSGAFRNQYPVLLEPGTAPYDTARDFALDCVRTPRPMWRSPLGADPHAFRPVAFSPDGRFLVVSGRGGAIECWNLLTGALTTVHSETQDDIRALSFSPDGKILISGGGSEIALWDSTNSWSQSRELRAPQAEVTCLSFSPRGGIVAGGCQDGSIIFWDLNEGAEPRVVAAHHGDVMDLAFSPDGGMLVTGGMDGIVKLWAVKNGVALRDLAVREQAVESLAYSPNGKGIACGWTDQSLTFFDLPQGAELARNYPDSGSVVAFSPDGETLASGVREDGIIRLWAPGADMESIGLIMDPGGLANFAFSPDGMTLASSGESITLWDLRNGRGPMVLASRPMIESLAFSADGKMLGVGSADESVTIWDPLTGVSRRTLSGVSAGVRYLAFGPDGKEVAAQGNIGRLWDLQTESPPKTLPGSRGAGFLAFSPDGRFLATRDLGRIHLWDRWEAGKQIEVKVYGKTITKVAFSPDGRFLAGGASIGPETTIMLWEIDKMSEPRTLGCHPEQIKELLISADGKKLATSGRTTIMLWDLQNPGEHQTLLSRQQRIAGMAFHPDGNKLAAVGDNESVDLWDIGGNAPPLTLGSHATLELSFSPDGIILASRGEREVKLWNLSTGGTPKVLKSPVYPTRAMAFAPDGKTFASAGYGGTYLWDLEQVFHPHVNLAEYLAKGWLTISERSVTWNTASSDHSSDRTLDFVNIPGNCHVAKLRRGESAVELLYHFARARNWQSSLTMLPQIKENTAREQAIAYLWQWLALDARKRSLDRVLLAFRFEQIRDYPGAADLDSDDFGEVESAIYK